MITGLEKFKEEFSGLEDQYVLIGGVAAYLVLDKAGIQPRATKDLDIVLCMEALDADFGHTFWSFVKDGGYEIQQRSTGEKIFYRFSKPAAEAFPYMLELFSRAPDGMNPPAEMHLVPIPVADEVYSLSAILLDSDYYRFLHENKIEQGGLSIMNAEGLIPLKAKAWIDLTERKSKGENVDSRDIKKHRSDILRLYQLLNPDMRINTPDSIKADLNEFLDELAQSDNINLGQIIGLKNVTRQSIIDMIKQVYQL